MKRFLSVVLIVAVIALSACSDTKRIDGELYDTYGLFNKEEIRDPKIEYSLVMGNVIWGILLSGTIAAPVYFFGFDLYEPIQKRIK